MIASNRPEYRPVRLAEKIMAVLAEGGFTATYKYAVLLGLIDLCIENTKASGEGPTSLTTRQLAEKIVEIYWPHTLDFHHDRKPIVLLQNTGHVNSQAEIIKRIFKFREHPDSDKTISLTKAKANKKTASRFETLVRSVEWKLIEMPLPRLQVYGGKEDRFLYEIAWRRQDTKGELAKKLRTQVREYLDSDGLSDFDNRILLKKGVGDDLVLLNRLLRPLIHRQWSAKVAKINHLAENKLEEFLFGVDRISTSPVRPILWEVQEGRCFYCEQKSRSEHKMHVDHFIPWSRYPNNAIENLVLAHEKCNGQKKDYLASCDHLHKWTPRMNQDSEVAAYLAERAHKKGWESNQQRSASVARAVYFGLPNDAMLWVKGKVFEGANPEELKILLSQQPHQRNY